MSTNALKTNDGPRWLCPILVLLFLAWLAILIGTGLTRAGLELPWPMPWFYSSSALCLAAWAHWLARRGGPAGRFALGIAVGMTLGTLADWRGGLTVIIPLFSLGHLAYMSGAWSLAGRLGLRRRSAWLASWGICILMGVALWYASAARAPEVGVYLWPSLGYTVLLSALLGTMTAMMLGDRRFAPMALGALLVFTSDVLLSMQQFRHTPWASDEAVWLIYGPGQMLIVFGATAVSGLTGREEWSVVGGQ